MAPESADTRPPRNGPMLRHRSPAYNCGSIEGAVRGGSTVVAAAKTATRLVNVQREMSAGIMLRTCWRRMIGESPEYASDVASSQRPRLVTPAGQLVLSCPVGDLKLPAPADVEIR